MIWREVHHN